MTEHARWMVAGDVNQGIEPVRRLLDAPNSFGDPPMGAFWSTGFQANPKRVIMAHADHKVLKLITNTSVVAVVNCTWQWGGDKELLNKIARWADVMLMVECRTANNKPLMVRNFIGDTHKVLQNTENSALSGSAIALRKDADIVLRRTNLSQISPKGYKVQARHLRDAVVIDHGVKTRYGATHLALASSHVQDDGERKIKQWVARARRD